MEDEEDLVVIRLAGEDMFVARLNPSGMPIWARGNKFAWHVSREKAEELTRDWYGVTIEKAKRT